MVKYEYCMLVINAVTQKLSCPIKPGSISKEVAGMAGTDIVNGLGELSYGQMAA